MDDFFYCDALFGPRRSSNIQFVDRSSDLTSSFGGCAAMLQTVMLSESEASAFPLTCRKQILRLRLRMTF
jgi:hypothetical protein